MGLADDLKKVPINANNCCVARARQHFDGEDLEMLNQVITAISKRKKGDNRSSGPNQTWLAEVLTNNGFKISAKGLSNHFCKACSCGSV